MAQKLIGSHFGFGGGRLKKRMSTETTLAITMHNTHSTVTCEGSKRQFQTMVLVAIVNPQT